MRALRRWVIGCLAALGAPVAWANAPERGGPTVFVAPTGSYDTTLGLAGGLFGNLVWPARAAGTPFAANVAAQVLASTRGFKYGYVRWDIPAIGGTPLRWDAFVRAFDWPTAPYFRPGEAGLRVADGPPTVHTYAQRRLAVNTHLRWKFPASEAEPYLGLLAAGEQVRLPAGSQVAADRPPGAAGGAFVSAAVGVLYDDRIDEINPRSGTLVDGALRLAHPALGSDWTAPGVHLSARRFLSWGPRVVSATRLLGDAHAGTQPFWQDATLGGISRVTLGGRFLLRGLTDERLRADAVLAAQQELRVHLVKHQVRRSSLEWMLVPFGDGAWLATRDDGFGRPWLSGGVGARAVLNDLLVLRADVGFAQERTTAGRRPATEVYLLSDHPF